MIMIAHRLVSYIKNSTGQGILMYYSSTFSLTTLCDFDWGDCKEILQSLTGLVDSSSNFYFRVRDYFFLSSRA